jgi:hypothetical protein
MENVMVFDEKTKAKIGVICFIPIACFFICFIYFLLLILPLTHGNPEPSSVVGITARHYMTLFYMLAASAIITTPIFIYCLVLLTRMKHLNSPAKLMWIIFLSTCAPIASALFWLFLIREVPTYVGMHPDIA